MLHLLGMEGPRTKEPAKYIRYIYNRVILENATVRAAAVSSLAQFGALVEELRPRVQVLLKRALHDNDDEVTPASCPAACALLAGLIAARSRKEKEKKGRREVHYAWELGDGRCKLKSAVTNLFASMQDCDAARRECDLQRVVVWVATEQSSACDCKEAAFAAV